MENLQTCKHCTFLQRGILVALECVLNAFFLLKTIQFLSSYNADPPLGKFLVFARDILCVGNIRLKLWKLFMFLQVCPHH